MNENFWFALALTTLAGLSTGIGSLIGLFAKKDKTKFLSVALGFSAGVMLFVSFVDIYPKANEYLSNEYSDKMASWVTLVCFFVGMIFIALIDKLIHKKTDSKDVFLFIKAKESKDRKKLLKMGMFTALAIAIHNFPEGLATFMSALDDTSIGISLAIVIAIHNIPEGLAVSTPIYYATGSKKKAFLYSFLSGLTEPLGALIGYFVLMQFMSSVVMGCVFAIVAGIMVFISLDELLPTARKYGEHHLSIYGLIAGMIIMAISLQLF